MEITEIIKAAEKDLQEQYQNIDEIAYFNQAKVLKAFQNNRIRDTHFNTSSGYGYGDVGRDDLEKVYADIFKAEDAMVRAQIVSGTHAISACLFALLRPNDEFISVLGTPYDTLSYIIGNNNKERGTLIEKGISYSEVPLLQGVYPDYEAIAAAISNQTKLVLIQRSKGYSQRIALNAEHIKRLVKIIKGKNPQTIVFVDNCYGEFTDVCEPIECGADIMAGSLIKNPGGGLVVSGGYIVGRADLIKEISYHLTAPGLGKELGASLINPRLLYQGIFLAPHVVAQALKGALLLAYVGEKFGYHVNPTWQEKRGDIVQSIRLENADNVKRFCQIIQNSSPVDSDVTLEYADLPGYNDAVIMAAGTFVQGSSIEISCDAPLREPYNIYLQGGLTYEHCRYVVQELLKKFFLA
jgi:cystathionine beta-lyase family protein involved in aluminum resistance